MVKQVRELDKRGFDTERLRQLQECLFEIGAKSGLTGKEAVAKFFDDLKDYGAVLEAKALLEGLQTQIETKKLEAENWQAKEEVLRRKHDDLKEAVAAIYALRAKGVKVTQIPVWQRILNRFETVERFDENLVRYANMVKLLSAKSEEAESYELRLTEAKSQLETLEKERAKIEAGIEALRVTGVKELKAMTEATEKQLKAVAASELREAQTIGQEIRKEFANYFVQLDKLLEKAVHLGQEIERSKQELRSYNGVKNVLEAHAVPTEVEK